MSDVKLLVCGAFNEEERARFDANYPNVYAASPDDIAGVDADTRAGITAVVFKGHAPFGGAAMDPLENLGLIANFGVGYDAIDVVAASERGIKVVVELEVFVEFVAHVQRPVALEHVEKVICREWREALVEDSLGGVRRARGAIAPDELVRGLGQGRGECSGTCIVLAERAFAGHRSPALARVGRHGAGCHRDNGEERKDVGHETETEKDDDVRSHAEMSCCRAAHSTSSLLRVLLPG